MRGDEVDQGHMFSYVSAEKRVPADHPLRKVRKLVDAALEKLSKDFDQLYADTGRPSIPPERLLRGERMLMEQLDYNLLFRWFVGLQMDDPVWVPTTFAKNRTRLLEGDIAQRFLRETVAMAQEHGLTSAEHFSVDGTLLEAWASATAGADRAYDTRDFVARLRVLGITPHVAQQTKRRRSAIDGRTTRFGGYRASQIARKRVEHPFGWIKSVAGLFQMKHRGLRKVDWVFTFATAAYNLTRLRRLIPVPA